MRILHVTIFGEQGTGASKAYDACWRGISDLAYVIVVKPGEVDRLSGKGTSYEELKLATPRPSDHSSFREVVRRLFGARAPQMMADLDDMVRGLVLSFRLRGVMQACDRIHSDSMWFTTWASLRPSLRRKLVHTELAGDWKFVSDGTADSLTYLSYGVLARRVLDRVSVIAQSEVHAELLVSCGVDRRRVRVVRHGRVDSSVFHPTSPKDTGTFSVLFVGRIVPQKGVHVLLEALRGMVSDLPGANISVTVVGPVGEFGVVLTTSDYLENLTKSVERFGLTEVVHFRYFVRLEDLVDLYSSASVYVLPSLQDAFPFSVIEAMMCGTPVIGTSSGGMKEQIEDGVTGFVVPPGDPDALREKLEVLYRDSVLLGRMSLAARSSALARFPLEGFSAEMFDAVVSGHGETAGGWIR
ncbi:MAG TPA: glycosyltransferase family 4 protein [Conexivisphaerales archaeon]|nr:glycosyltransferase family 4 protein [Conexivisphaerales archaeon]